MVRLTRLVNIRGLSVAALFRDAVTGDRISFGEHPCRCWGVDFQGPFVVRGTPENLKVFRVTDTGDEKFLGVHEFDTIQGGPMGIELERGGRFFRINEDGTELQVDRLGTDWQHFSPNGQVDLVYGEIILIVKK